MNSRSTSLVLMLLMFAGCTANKALDYESKATVTPVSSNNFDQLWNASLDSLHEYHFEIDRQDRRAGIITTKPMTSSQFFEPWRNELKSADAVAESSLATVRRTATIEITRQGGQYSALPSVRVERLSLRGRRTTNSAQYTTAFRASPERGTKESDRGIKLPDQYWYDIGYDSALASSVSRQIARRLK